MGPWGGGGARFFLFGFVFCFCLLFILNKINIFFFFLTVNFKTNQNNVIKVQIYNIDEQTKAAPVKYTGKGERGEGEKGGGLLKHYVFNYVFFLTIVFFYT